MYIVTTYKKSCQQMTVWENKNYIAVQFITQLKYFVLQNVNVQDLQ